MVLCFLKSTLPLLIPDRLVNISQQWRSRRGSQEIRWLWISSSRGRRGSSLLYQGLLPLDAPRLSYYLHLRCPAHMSQSQCDRWPCICLVAFRLISLVLCSKPRTWRVKAYRRLLAFRSMMHLSWLPGERSMEQMARYGLFLCGGWILWAAAPSQIMRRRLMTYDCQK